MKKPITEIPVFIFTFILLFSGVDSSACAATGNGNPMQELPRVDQCSVITITIRQMAFELKKNAKEASLLEPPVPGQSEKTAESEQRMHEYEQKLKLLQERASSLREQIDMKEKQLESCMQYSNISHEP